MTKWIVTIDMTTNDSLYHSDVLAIVSSALKTLTPYMVKRIAVTGVEEELQDQPYNEAIIDAWYATGGA